VQLEKDADFGWPECYYDGIQNKLVLAPEYGGDGKKIERCPSPLMPRQIRSLWADASSTARLQVAPVSVVMASMRKVRRRHQRSSVAIGWTAMAACRESRGPLWTACRSQSIIPFRCRHAAARRCQSPMSRPSLLMFGRSVMQMDGKAA
jgi:hypothetical protein